jgi:hypothetical protein
MNDIKSVEQIIKDIEKGRNLLLKGFDFECKRALSQAQMMIRKKQRLTPEFINILEKTLLNNQGNNYN